MSQVTTGVGTVLRLTSYGVLWTLPLLASSCFGQAQVEQPGMPTVDETFPVNWLYGAFIPKDAPIQPLTNEERFKLYLRQTYTTSGTYIKTGFFVIHDQAVNAPPGWGDGVPGFGKRLGSIQTQNIIQNSLTSLGDAVAKVEPRYDRCRCDGAWPRIRHAIVRNFITDGGPDDKAVRPQIVPYAAAFGAGVAVASWEPQNQSVLTKGYQNVATQIWIGVVIDALAEFAPDVKRMFHRNEKKENAKLSAD
jgi:hypothetical protein